MPEMKTGRSIVPIVLDELTFMQECADRFNQFLRSYPREAQHVLSHFIRYQHELVEVHRNYRRLTRAAQGKPPEKEEPTPGAPLASLVNAILQTQGTATGYYLRPILVPGDEPDDMFIEKFEVVSHDEDPDYTPLRD